MKKFLLSLLAIVAATQMVVHKVEATACFEPDTYWADQSCANSCSRGTFFVDAEALYLRAYQGGLSSLCDVLEIEDTTIDNTTNSLHRGHGREPHFNWDWGFRIGAGYDFACNDCGMRAYWTHYNNSSGKKDHNSSRKKNHTRWKLDYDVVDLVFRCDSDLSCGLTFSPFAGIKIAEIRQKLHTHFIGLLDAFPTDSISHVKQRFEGVGPVIGAKGSWDWRCGFSFYGSLDVAMLYGNTHIKANGVDTFATGANISHFKNHKNAYQFVFDAEIGIQWQRTFCGRVVALQLGLENHRYFNQNQFCDQGDLSLDGVKLGLSFDF